MIRCGNRVQFSICTGERTLPEFPRVALWREVSTPCMEALGCLDLCSSGICFRQRSKEESGWNGSWSQAVLRTEEKGGPKVRAGCGCKTASEHESGLSTNNNWDHGYRLEHRRFKILGCVCQACTTSQATCSTCLCVGLPPRSIDRWMREEKAEAPGILSHVKPSKV